MENIKKQLEAQFTKKVNGVEYPAIKWLPKTLVGKNKDKCICIPYIDKNMVSQRLDDVFGVSGWMDDVKRQDDGTYLCQLSVKIDDKWVTRSDVGTESNMEKEKGASSDSFKRAAAKFGIGRYLSELPTRFCKAKILNEKGKFVPVDDSGRQLFGDNLSNHMNGLSVGQGLLYQLISEMPELWQRDDVKKLWNDLK